MRSINNSRPEICASNLLMITRGEIPYERLKGVDPRLFDRPSVTVISEIRADVAWVLRTYEQRTSLDEVGIDSLIDKAGQFGVRSDIQVRGAI